MKIRAMAVACARESFYRACARAGRFDFLGISSRKVAAVVMANRNGADDVLLRLAAKAEAASGLPELMSIHREVYSLLEAVDCPLQRNHLGPDPFGLFRSSSIERLDMDSCFLGGVFGLKTLPVSGWERIRGRDGVSYDIVRRQYSRIISSNARAAADVVRRESSIDIIHRHRRR